VLRRGAFSPSSRGRLTSRDLDRFAGDTLFDRVARAVCRAGCLPRKELYEAWEVARRVRRLFRGGRVVDLGAGHGLLAQIMLVLDDSSRARACRGQGTPPSAMKLRGGAVEACGCPTSLVTPRDEEILPTDVVVSSSHAPRTPDVIRGVPPWRAVAVLPCCVTISRLRDAGG
jgi:hypothetical protein